MSYPLEGIKVLDFSRVLAGPFATRMLSDLGADVLKVEPPEGDSSRYFGCQDFGVAGFYLQNNIGKRNICIDMKADGSRDLILDLAAQADIVVENFRPGVMDKFDIGWDDLHARYPKLVMLSISGFGQQGPERARGAYAPIIHAEAGIIARQAEMSGGPAYDMQMSMADTYSGLHGLVGIFAALRVAEQTGEGQHVDIAMIDVMHASDDYAHWALDGAWPKPQQGLVWDAPEGHRVQITADMKWLWTVFSEKGGIIDPAPEGADVETKIKLRFELIRDTIAGFESFDALTSWLDELNLVWGQVLSFGDDSYNQKSVAARKILVDVIDDKGHPRRTVQSPYRFSRSQSGITSDARPPKRGEHNADALEDWLGLSREVVAYLSDQGILLSE